MSIIYAELCDSEAAHLLHLRETMQGKMKKLGAIGSTIILSFFAASGIYADGKPAHATSDIEMLYLESMEEINEVDLKIQQSQKTQAKAKAYLNTEGASQQNTKEAQTKVETATKNLEELNTKQKEAWANKTIIDGIRKAFSDTNMSPEDLRLKYERQLGYLDAQKKHWNENPKTLETIEKVRNWLNGERWKGYAKPGADGKNEPLARSAKFEDGKLIKGDPIDPATLDKGKVYMHRMTDGSWRPAIRQNNSVVNDAILESGTTFSAQRLSGGGKAEADKFFKIESPTRLGNEMSFSLITDNTKPTTRQDSSFFGFIRTTTSTQSEMLNLLPYNGTMPQSNKRSTDKLITEYRQDAELKIPPMNFLGTVLAFSYSLSPKFSLNSTRQAK